MIKNGMDLILIGWSNIFANMINKIFWKNYLMILEKLSLFFYDNYSELSVYC